jgi:hypothetical protein
VAGKAVTLAEPAVAFIQTSVVATVRLTVQDSTQISGVNYYDSKYRFIYGTGSGFFVNNSGGLVTGSHVIEPDRQTVRNYIANQLFFTGELGKIFGYSIDGYDPFDQYDDTGDSVFDQSLRQCYDSVACKFEISPRIKVFTAVQAAGTQQPKGAPARVLKSTGFDNTDIAVMQIDGDNLPTVALAESANDLLTGDDLNAVGFAGSAQDLPTGVTEPTNAFGKVSSVRSVGSSRQVQADIRLEPGMSGGPAVDDQGQVVGLVSYARLDANQQPTNAYLRTVDDIRKTLKAAGVQPSRGQVDALFSQAMSYMWDRHFSEAVPLLQRLLNLSAGHPLAKRYLVQAQAKVLTPEDLPLPRLKHRRAFPKVLLMLLTSAVLLATLMAVLIGQVARRTRRSTGVHAKRRAASESSTPSGQSDRLINSSAHNNIQPTGDNGPTVVQQSYDTAVHQDRTLASLEPNRGSVSQQPRFGVEDGMKMTMAIAEDSSGIDYGVSGSSAPFCIECGSRLLKGRFCSTCGTPINPSPE